VMSTVQLEAEHNSIIWNQYSEESDESDEYSDDDSDEDSEGVQ
jgi:hypothetical protein